MHDCSEIINSQLDDSEELKERSQCKKQVDFFTEKRKRHKKKIKQKRAKTTRAPVLVEITIYS